MSDLTTNENQNENKYDLFKGVLVVDVGAVTQYSLIYMSETEIIAESTINYKDAEDSLKILASWLGFNCVLNVVRENHTESMETSGTMHTEGYSDGKISKGWFGSYNTKSKIKAESTINTETKVNNYFRIKGTLAIIGKPNPNGDVIDLDYAAEMENMAYECMEVIRAIYETNYMVDNLRSKKSLRITNLILTNGLVVLLRSIPYVGAFASIFTMLFVLLEYINIKDGIDSSNNVYNNYEPKLKNLVSEYSYDGVLNIYRVINCTSIKHIGA